MIQGILVKKWTQQLVSQVVRIPPSDARISRSAGSYIRWLTLIFPAKILRQPIRIRRILSTISYHHSYSSFETKCHHPRSIILIMVKQLGQKRKAFIIIFYSINLVVSLVVFNSRYFVVSLQFENRTSSTPVLVNYLSHTRSISAVPKLRHCAL